MSSIIPDTAHPTPPAPPPPPSTPPVPPSYPRRAIDYDGSLWQLYKIVILNLVLTLLTLGLYRFWAKTRLRRFLWGNATANQDRLEYAGTGNELLLGFLIVLFPILLPLFLVLGTSNLLLQGFAPNWVWVIDFTQPLLILFLIGVALFRARYYRLTRTRWRGIRAGQTGSAMRYGLMVLASYLAAIFSAGLSWPWSQAWLFRYKMSNTWLGNRRFEFDGSSAALYPSFLAAWAATLVLPFVIMMAVGVIVALTVGFEAFEGLEDVDLDAQLAPGASETEPFALSGWAAVASAMPIVLVVFAVVAAWQWFNAAKYRLFARHSRLDSLGFTLQLTGWSLAKFTLANLALLLLTVGLALPWILHRRAKFYAKRLMAHGTIDYGGVGQSPLRAPETGEGLADAFDIGGI